MLYFTTDGYVDNPAPNRVKIGTRELRRMLVDNQEKPLEEQSHVLTSVLDQVAEHREQRDDITIIGVKLK